MKPFNIDLSVLIIFFARPEHLARVFEQVKIARPSKLYLYQDGPRENREDDIENIRECRNIVANIDWNCEVNRLYQERNFGCDPSEYIAQKWMFDREEYGVVLEDDDVPSQSFFPFCKELLERYKDDERIGVICGMNNVGAIESPHSYIFARTGSIWGWATWKRNVDLWEEHYDWLTDDFSLKLLKESIGTTDFRSLLKTSLRHRSTGKAYYETIVGSSVLLHSQLNIIPTMNLISNIGIGSNGTHSVDSLSKLPKGIRRVLFMKTHDIEFPLKHPKYVIENIEYKRKLDRVMGNGYPLVKIYRRGELILYRIVNGDISNIIDSLKRKFKLG